MRNALVIGVDNSLEVIDLDAPEGSLKVLQGAVGGWIEAVDISETLTLWCNEEGKLLGMPANPFATKLSSEAIQTSDWIAGNAVLTGGVDDEGDTLGLTEEQVETFKFIFS
jgi:hypothetical protein